MPDIFDGFGHITSPALAKIKEPTGIYLCVVASEFEATTERVVGGPIC